MKKLINSSIICIACFSGNVFGQTYLGKKRTDIASFFELKKYEKNSIERNIPPKVTIGECVK
jgi:hypothetical protein